MPETNELFEMLKAAYLRGHDFAHEHGFGAYGVTKAAYDYADKTTSELERRTSQPVAWTMRINHGPEGEANYANVYDGDGQFVGNLKTHHASAIVASFASPPQGEPVAVKGHRHYSVDEGGLYYVAPAPSLAVSDETMWFSPEIPPTIPKGSERYFIVAVRRAHSGKVWSFPATYLNAYPLTFEICECEAEHSDDGCPSTGWFTVSSEGEYDENYLPLLSPGDELVAWSEIQLHPLDARLTAAIGASHE